MKRDLHGWERLLRWDTLESTLEIGAPDSDKSIQEFRS